MSFKVLVPYTSTIILYNYTTFTQFKHMHYKQILKRYIILYNYTTLTQFKHMHYKQVLKRYIVSISIQEDEIVVIERKSKVLL